MDSRYHAGPAAVNDRNGRAGEMLAVGRAVTVKGGERGGVSPPAPVDMAPYRRGFAAKRRGFLGVS